MKISVVVPTYQRPELLLRCLDSLALQTFPMNEFEIIVATDGPDDSLSNVLLRYQMKHTVALRVFSLPGKKGPAAARNLGWRNAGADFIAFTDDDCLPHGQWLENLWNARQTNTSEMIAFSGNTTVPVEAPPTDYEKNISLLAEAEFITANCACTRPALEKVNGFDEAFTMAWREDSDLQFRFLEANIPIVKVSTAVVTHPVRKAPWGVSIKEEKKGTFNALLYKKFPSLYKQRIQPTAPLLYYAIACSLLVLFSGLIANSVLIAVCGAAVWSMLTGYFIFKRLERTTRTASHIAEMVVTSAVIPILSLYWRIYGAIKFRSPLFP